MGDTPSWSMERYRLRCRAQGYQDAMPLQARRNQLSGDIKEYGPHLVLGSTLYQITMEQPLNNIYLCCGALTILELIAVARRCAWKQRSALDDEEDWLVSFTLTDASRVY
jgi:hypothetical protein